jgi:hypothetical protein
MDLTLFARRRSGLGGPDYPWDKNGSNAEILSPLRKYQF